MPDREDVPHDGSMWNVTKRQYLRRAGALGALSMTGLAGCTGGGDSSNTTLNYAGGPADATSSQMATAWSEVISNQTDGSVQFSVETGTGSQTNVRTIGQGQHDLGYVTAQHAVTSSLGKDPFDQSWELNTLMSTFSYAFLMYYTTVDSDIDYVKELAGRRVAGNPTFAGIKYLQRYLEIHGLEQAEVVNTDLNEAVELVTEGRVDAALGYGTNHQLPTYASQWLTREDSAKLVVPESEEDLRAFTDHEGSYGLDTFEVRADNYKHAWENSAVSGEDTWPFVGEYQVQVASPDLDADIAEQIVSIALNNGDSLVEFHDFWTGFASDPGAMATGFASEEAPFHPGAVAALKDSGAWSDDLPEA